jgi:hypothetical protein
LSTRLVLVHLGPGSSSIKGGYVIFIIHSVDGAVVLADLVDFRRWLGFAFSLCHGCVHVHLLDRHLFLILLCHHSSEFRCQCSLEQVHLEEVEHHGCVLLFESPEGLIGDAMVNVVVQI